jgi:hypothetical protein
MKHVILWCVIPLMLAAVWWVVSPGVFVLQPIGAAPEGIMFLYYGRGPGLPVITSPDGMCLQLNGGVSLWCRLTALAGLAKLSDRSIVRLPYSETAYLWSTGGHTFDR